MIRWNLRIKQRHLNCNCAIISCIRIPIDAFHMKNASVQNPHK